MLVLFCVSTQAKNNILGPPDSDGPVVVDIGFYLSNVNFISEADETFHFEGVLSMHWKDPRLAFDPAVTGYDNLYYQGYYQFNEVFTGWWPQVFLANEAGGFEQQGIVLRITPDGNVYYTEEIEAVAKSHFKLARYPFDRQQLAAIFEVLGFESEEVLLRVDPASSGIWDDDEHKVEIPQWYSPELSSSVVEYRPSYLDGRDGHLSAFRVQIDIERDPRYTLRLVGLPVIIFVILSWSVFWMDRSSVGDRMDITFMGILTVVAYQIMFSGSLPKISYPTILGSFMMISFVTMCASVVVNLRVWVLDSRGLFENGDRLDQRSRYLFPIVYVLSILLAGGSLYVAG
ncbi:MAG: hypothetical protein QNL94_10635, partial [Halioglobus sp.]